jgi:hypothetical protein
LKFAKIALVAATLFLFASVESLGKGVDGGEADPQGGLHTVKAGGVGFGLRRAPTRLEKKVTDVVVSDAAGLSAALRTAHGGDVIRLAPGDYGKLSIKNLTFDTPVTVTSDDPATRAVTTELTLSNVHGLVVSNLEVAVVPGEKGVYVLKSSDVRIESFDLHGTLDNDPNGDGTGMQVRWSDNVTVTNSEFHELAHGLGHLDSSNLLFSNNEFHDLRIDGIRGGGSSFVTISGNTFRDFYRNEGDHPDAIQFWTTNTTASAHDITIANNSFYRGDGGRAQGIFLRDEKTIYPYENVKISGNAIYGGMPNGITVAHGHNIEITDNIVLGYSDQASKIRVELSDGVVIKNNVTSHFVLNGNGEDFILQDNTMKRSPDVGNDEPLVDWLRGHSETPALVPLSQLDLGHDTIQLGAVDPSTWTGWFF